MTFEEAILEMECILAEVAGDPDECTHPDAERQREAWAIIKESAEFGKCTRDALKDE